MTTTTNNTMTFKSNINKVIDNCFTVKRMATKRGNEFIGNRFERPVTPLDFFQLLDNSGINLTSGELILYICNINCDNYHVKYNRAKLVINRRSAIIVFKDSEYLNITLDFDKLTDMFEWFKDRSLFSTDYSLRARVQQ
jgi:hypothetical protein